MEPGLFWRGGGLGLIRGLSGRGRKELNMREATEGRAGLGTAWGSVGRSRVAREGDNPESMMRMREVYKAEGGHRRT